MRSKYFVGASIAIAAVLVALISSRKATPPSIDEARPKQHADATPTREIPGAFQELLASGKPVGQAEVHMEVERLKKLPSEQHGQMLARFLDSQANVNLGGRFALRADGSLAEWPTLRVAVLDASETLSADAALTVAQKVLETSSSADEWAVALRIVGRLGRTPSHRALFLAKTRELLRNPQWLATPTVGFLQGFDAVVYAGDANLLTALAPLTADHHQRAVRWAAFIAADRFATEYASASANFLNEHQELFADAPELRAGLFARLDVRSLQQKIELENYLTRTDLSETELRAFGALFPNHNTTWSNNLLSGNRDRAVSEMMAVDRASLQTLQEWIRDPRFARWAGVLNEAHRRVAGQLAGVLE